MPSRQEIIKQRMTKSGRDCKRIFQEKRQRIVEAYKPGLSCAKLAKRFHISETSVWHILRDAGVPIVNARAKWSPERDAELIHYCNDLHLDPYEISERMNLTTQQLRNRVSQLRHENQQRTINFSFSRIHDK